MPLFRKLTDEEQIEKWNKEAVNKRNKLFDKIEGDLSFVEGANLIDDDNIYATDFVQIDPTNIRINIGYKKDMGFFVGERFRVRIDVFTIGSLLCKDVKAVTSIELIKKSNIKVNFFTGIKSIHFPTNNKGCFNITCKKIIIEFMETYTLEDNKKVTVSQKLNSLEKQLYKR